MDSKPTPTLKNSLGMEFVLVPKGKSWLGGGSGKPGTKEVEFKDDFYLGKYEVTQEDWRKVIPGLTKEEFNRFPAAMVWWEDCQEFVSNLNALAPEPGWVYRFPTEAEWEYACRGGPMSSPADGAFDYYLDKPSNTVRPDQANFKESGLERACKVGSYAPNRLGLHDMHGNVGEWCVNEDPKDPKKQVPVLRGGHYLLHAKDGKTRAGISHQTPPRGSEAPRLSEPTRIRSPRFRNPESSVMILHSSGSFH